jgi:hypothetical protein
MASKKNRSRKSLAVALAIVGVAGLSMASAAQLNVTSDTVAAGVSVVSACDSTVTVSYGTAFVGGAYTVSSVTVNGVGGSACNGRTLDFTLLGAADAVLGSGSKGIVTADTSETISGLSADAASLIKIEIVIH